VYKSFVLGEKKLGESNTGK